MIINKIIDEDLELIFRSTLVDWTRLYHKSVLITGAYGMLGAYLTFILIYINETQPNANIRILAVGRDKSKFIKRFGTYIEKKYFEMVLGDVSFIDPAIPKADYIIHAASHASPHHYGSHPVDVILPNVLGTWKLLEKARTDLTEGFLFISSGAAQGNFNNIDINSITERDMGYIDPMDIRSCYDESKRLGETLCQSYHYQYDIPIKVARPVHTYGPTIDLNDTRVFSEFVANAVRGEDITIKSDGTPIRIFCYISDATLAFYKILLDAPAGEAYTVVNSNNKISVGELAKIVVEVSGNPNLKIINVNRSNDSYIVSAQVDKVPYYNASKIDALGWQSQVSIKEGFRRTIESFR